MVNRSDLAIISEEIGRNEKIHKTYFLVMN